MNYGPLDAKTGSHAPTHIPNNSVKKHLTHSMVCPFIGAAQAQLSQHTFFCFSDSTGRV